MNGSTAIDIHTRPEFSVVSRKDVDTSAWEWASERLGNEYRGTGSSIPTFYIVGMPKCDISSAMEFDAISHASARLKSFRNLTEDWDGEGASAPDRRAIDAAVDFLGKLQPWHPRPDATVDSDGHPVVEFQDKSLFGKIRFLTASHVEMFALCGELPAAFSEGDFASESARKFLSNELQITLLP